MEQIEVQEELNIGTLKVGVPSIVTLSVKNISEDTLTIKITSSCGCSTPDPIELTLAPDEIGETRVTIIKTKEISYVSVRVYYTVTKINSCVAKYCSTVPKTTIVFNVIN